jgi:hypothetical protein
MVICRQDGQAEANAAALPPYVYSLELVREWREMPPRCCNDAAQFSQLRKPVSQKLASSFGRSRFFYYRE